MTQNSAQTAGAPRRGALLRMPAEVAVTDAARAGLDFVLLDLINGPADETLLLRHVRLAHAAGLRVLVSVEDPGALIRVARLGVDAAVMASARGLDTPTGLAIVDTRQLTVVDDPAAPSETLYTAVDLAAVRIRALTAFKGPADRPDPLPLVLLPGQLGDVSVWDEVVERLPEAGRYLALRIDLDDSIRGMAESVLAAAPPRFALAGHSLGGIVALEICRTAPERVDRLALLNASGRAASPEQLDSWRALNDQLDDGRFDEVVEALAVANLRPEDPDLDTHRDRWRQMARTVGPAGLRRQLAAQASRPDSLPTLDQLRLPILIVSGSADDVCRPELQAELMAGLPTAEHVTIPAAGHMSPLTAPVQIAEQLARWMV